ncbi:hypothetical protein ACOME3_000548 [Neoechinorhynchus agilis]
MLELELIDVLSIDDLMDTCEQLVQASAEHLLTKCEDEVVYFSARERCERLMNKFIGSVKSADQPTMNKAMENLIVQKCGNKSPVFVTHYPRDQKPFYMKSAADPNHAECFDLLAADSGEIAGGSMRENGKLRLPMASNLDWYQELRFCGYPSLGGFGIGIERLLMSALGLRYLRSLALDDTIAEAEELHAGFLSYRLSPLFDLRFPDHVYLDIQTFEFTNLTVQYVRTKGYRLLNQEQKDTIKAELQKSDCNAREMVGQPYEYSTSLDLILCHSSDIYLAHTGRV